MCGIGGIYLPDGVVLTEALKVSIESTFSALEDRGTHACGFAWSWLDSDAVNAWKGAMSASTALKYGKMDRTGLMCRTILLHTRYTTQGSTAYNGNNHPVLRDGITLTHNGVLWNDDEVFRHFGLSRLHQVDTEAINASLRHGGVEWLVENVSGSYSLAWMDETRSTQEVNLLTNGRNPLVIARTVEGAIVWASNLYHLDSFNLESSFNASPFKHYTLNPDGIISSAWVSDRRESPKVFNRNTHRHASVYGSSKPKTCPTPTPKPAKGRKTPSKQSKGQTRIERGFIFDASLNGWRKANSDDWMRYWKND